MRACTALRPALVYTSSIGFAWLSPTLWIGLIVATLFLPRSTNATTQTKSKHRKTKYRFKLTSYHGHFHRSYPLRLRKQRFYDWRRTIITLSQQRKLNLDQAKQDAGDLIKQSELPTRETTHQDGWIKMTQNLAAIAGVFPSFDPILQSTAMDQVYCCEEGVCATHFNRIAATDHRSFINATENSQKGTIVVDSGASESVSHVRSDLESFEPRKSRVLKGLALGLAIEGEGMVKWLIPSTDGTMRTFFIRALYVPAANQRLLCPQSYLQQIKKSEPKNREHVKLTNLALSIVGHSHLPVVEIPFHAQSNLPVTLCFTEKGMQQQHLALNNCVTNSTNKNLDPSQKELLKWHFRLGHISMAAIQHLLGTGTLAHSDSMKNLHRRASKCDKPKCASCEFGKGKRRPTPGKLEKVDRKNDGALTKEKLLPGQAVSVDHFICSTKGRLYTSAGKSADSKMYSGGALFVDHASKAVFVNMQIGMTMHETLGSKLEFENWLQDHGAVAQSYLTDNASCFTNDEYTNELKNFGQIKQFAGVGAHHHNALAERTIQTIMSMARTMMLHAALRWPDVADAQLWPMAVDHAAYLYNRLPNPTSGLTPLEVLSGTKWLSSKFHDLHVWGSPVYVLDPTLQDGKKIPRWKPQSRRAVYLGVSKLHSSNCPLVLNLQTGRISPQYHCVFDDWFSTVETNVPVDEIPDLTKEPWNSLFEDSRFQYPFDEDQDVPELSPEWTELGIEHERRQLNRDSIRRGFQQRREQKNVSQETTLPSLLAQNQPKQVRFTLPSDVTSVRNAQTESASEPINDSDGSDEPAEPPDEPETQQEQETSQELTREPQTPPREQPTQVLRRSRRSNMGKRVSRRYHEEFHSATAELHANLGGCEKLTDEQRNNFVELYAASASDPDTLSYDEAMRSQDAEEFKLAKFKEIDSLKEHETWNVVPKSQAPGKLLPGTWTFRRKRHPSGEIKKYKARWCARGDLEEKAEDTYAPVVDMTTVRMLLYFTLFFDLKTRCIDFSTAFLHAKLKDPIYMSYPRGIGTYLGPPDHCLKLKRSIYGLTIAPKLWFNHFKSNLLALDMVQSRHDPCLFYGKGKNRGLVLIQYVDDVILASKETKLIDSFIQQLKDRDFQLTDEGDLASYLGIAFSRDKTRGTITLKQVGLIDKILKATGMEDCNPTWTPATTTPLGQCKGSTKAKEAWSYPSIVGMLLYLAMNSRPDIAYSVSQVCRFTHDPREPHVKAVKMIVRYLKATKDRGLILKPDKSLALDSYVDADFAGLYGVEDRTDPVCVKSRTGYFIMIGGCPLVWKSKLQQLIALSTTEAETNAVCDMMRVLLPLRLLVQEMSSYFGLKRTYQVRTHSTVWEDNNGCITICNQDQVTPRSKHYAIRLFWWKSHAERPNIQVKKISTEEQLADCATKGLPRQQFEHLRRQIMGW